MDPKGIMLCEITSDRERQILYDFTHIWNLKDKINKQSKNRLIDTKNKLMVARWVGGWRDT